MTDFTRADLESFMRSFLLPPNYDMFEFLRWSDKFMNAGADDRDPPEVVEIGSTDNWTVRLSIWGASGRSQKPVIYHVHGGAWIAGTHLSHRGLALELADRGFVVVGIDYRRAPKHRFPAALNDVTVGLRWVSDNIADFSGDPQRIVVLGDSAGANLAACLNAEPGVYDQIRAAGFLYGIFDFASALPVMGRIIGPDRNSQAYLSVDNFDKLVDDPRVSPIRISDWRVPIYLGVGTGDPLLEQSRMMRDRLVHLGVPHEYCEFDQAPHSYVQIKGNDHYESGIDSVVRFFSENNRDLR